MARIRTIKPQFFKHGELYDLEQETGFPIRVAFAGLWTVCDREGRFKWKPRELKLDVIPYDEVDFSRVLDALSTRGFLVKYEVSGKIYGQIPNFSEHQVINNKESASTLPAQEEVIENKEEVDASSTREARVDNAKATPLEPTQGEGKGREGNNICPKSIPDQPEDYSEDFETFWKTYRRLNDKKKPAYKSWLKAIKKTKPEKIIEAAKAYVASMPPEKRHGEFQAMAATWLNGERYLDSYTLCGQQAPIADNAYDWLRAEAHYINFGDWPSDAKGRLDECPPEIMARVKEAA